MSESVGSTSSSKLLWIPIVSAALFGLYPPAAQIAYSDGANVVAVVLVTTACRAISLLAFCGWRGLALRLDSAKRGSVVSAGFFQALSVFGIIGSLAYVPGPVTITILFSSTSLLLLWMGLRGESRLDFVTLTSTFTALVGIALVLDLLGSAEDLRWEGLALATVAALATTSRTYLYGKQTRETHPAVLGAQVFCVAFVCCLALFLYQIPELPNSFRGYLALAASAISLSLGTFGMFYGIARLGAFRFSLYLKLEPLCTSLFSVLLLGQVLTAWQYLGVGLVVASLTAYQLLAEGRQ